MLLNVPPPHPRTPEVEGYRVEAQSCPQEADEYRYCRDPVKSLQPLSTRIMDGIYLFARFSVGELTRVCCLDKQEPV